jgi:hypothetical protein
VSTEPSGDDRSEPARADAADDDFERDWLVPAVLVVRHGEKARNSTIVEVKNMRAMSRVSGIAAARCP